MPGISDSGFGGCGVEELGFQAVDFVRLGLTGVERFRVWGLGLSKGFRVWGRFPVSAGSCFLGVWFSGPD